MSSTHYAKDHSYKILNNYIPLTPKFGAQKVDYFSDEILHRSLLYSVIDS